jgi:8-oxo-dGTP diphosphatase
MSEGKNPFPTADAIIEGSDGRIVLVLRKFIPHGWAIPGGFVDYGEEVGKACLREAKEETGLEVELIEQLFTYSDPRRDARKHTMSTVYWCKVRSGTLQAADDAQDARWFTEAEVPWKDLCFDHSEILRDYFRYRKTGERRKV